MVDIGAMASGEFCDSVVTTAIESGASWLVVHKYKWADRPVGGTYAVIEEDESDDDTLYTIDAALIRKGLDVIGRSVLRDTGTSDGQVLHNVDTGQRLYMSQDMARRLIHAATAGDDDFDFDAVDALAVVECGIFGAVTYA
jgi:hypothetical protein